MTPQEVAALPSRLQPTNLSIRPVHGTIRSNANAASNILASHGISTGAFGPRPGGFLAGP